MVGMLHLLRQPNEDGKLGLQCLDISKLSQRYNTPDIAIQNHLALSGLLGQTPNLGGVRQALCDSLRLPSEGVETKVQHGRQYQRVCEATRHSNALVGHRNRPFLSAREA